MKQMTSGMVFICPFRRLEPPGTGSLTRAVSMQRSHYDRARPSHRWGAGSAEPDPSDQPPCETTGSIPAQTTNPRFYEPRILNTYVGFIGISRRINCGMWDKGIALLSRFMYEDHQKRPGSSPNPFPMWGGGPICRRQFTGYAVASGLAAVV